MPTSFTVTALPASPLAPAHDDLHQLACHLLEPPASSDHQAERKPFAVWPLVPSRGYPEAVELRLNWLDDRQVVPRDRLHHRLSRGPRLGLVPLQVLDVAERRRPLASFLRAPVAPAYDLDFVTPTYFSRSGRDYPLPDPELLVRWLTARWNGCAGQDSPFLLGPEQQRALGSRVMLRRAALETVSVESAGGRRTAFRGAIRLGLTDHGEEAPTLLGILCAFAAYSGVGAQTTHGLGAVRATPADG